MNELNSVLLEGHIVDAPYRAPQELYHACRFTLASKRFYKIDDALQQETGHYTVEAWGSLCDTCMELKAGRGIRVVGRLRIEHSQVIIVAEHIEMRGAK